MGIFELAVGLGYKSHYPFDVVMDALDWSKEVKRIEAHLLVDWIREEKGIHITPSESWSFDNTLEYVCTVNGKYVNHGIEDKPINRFETYYQALEKGIEETLKLI